MRRAFADGKLSRARCIIEGVWGGGVEVCVISARSRRVSKSARGTCKEGKTYAATSKSMQLASPYPKLLHLESALQSALQAANVFFVPLDSK